MKRDESVACSGGQRQQINPEDISNHGAANAGNSVPAVQPMDAAIAVAIKQGWYVFPIGYNSDTGDNKLPLCKWRKDSTNDPDQIRRLFASRPQATGYGIDTGKSGLVILDFDGERGKETLAKLFERHGEPLTYVVRSSNGGHFYFQAPKGVEIRNSVKKIGQSVWETDEKTDVDTRGAGGFIVGAGSLHISGEVYEVLHDAPLLPCPQWVVDEHLGVTGSSTITEALADAQARTGLDRDRAERALTRMRRALAKAPKGTGNDTLNSQVFVTTARWGHVLDDETIKAAAIKGMTDRDARLYPSLVRTRNDEIQATIKSGLEAGRGENRKQRGGWRGKLTWNANGSAPLGDAANIVTVLRYHDDARELLRLNTRSRCVQLVRRPPWDVTGDSRYPRDLADEDATQACTWLRDAMGMSGVATGTVRQAMVGVARDYSVEPFREWLDELDWDGRPRLNTWLHDHAGADGSDLVGQFFRKWMIGAVKRTYEPGCKFDYTLLLEGPQGLKKSSFLRNLAGAEYFTDHLSDIGAKDAALELHGPAIVEMAELASLDRKEANSIKSFLTRQVDKVRPPYGASVVTMPRTCVFAGSTNQSEYLRDSSGGRRFWPVEVQDIDLDAVVRDRDQLWAEAKHLYESGERCWLDAETEREAAKEQAARRVAHPWEARLRAKLEKGYSVDITQSNSHAVDWFEGQLGADNRPLWITTAQALAWIGEGRSHSDAATMGNVLQALGWTKRQLRDGEHRGKRAYQQARGGN